MKYAILSPPYRHTSAGIKALEVLNAHLIAWDQTSRIITDGRDQKPPKEDEIVIYPDIYSGNKFNHPHVVRLLLNYAGYFGHDKDFPESEYLYYYAPEYVLNGRNPDNILTIPIVNESRFPHWSERKAGSCYLALKYHDQFELPLPELPKGCIRITNDTDLADLFGWVKKLITFDNSSINLEAELAGVEVEYRFNEKFTEKVLDGLSFQRLKEMYFKEQLPQFIERTQKRFGGVSEGDRDEKT